MAARLVLLGDAVVTALNGAPGGTFNQAFTAARKWLPRYTLEELASLKVTVVCGGPRQELATRGRRFREDLSIDVAVQKKVAVATEEADVDSLAELFQQIGGFLLGGTLTAGSNNYTALTLEGVSGDDRVWFPDHLRDKHVFTAAARLSYRSGLV